MDTARLSQIVAPLLDWFAHNARDLPWRQDREPYHVWLSEIMLQQTRVEAVKAYYARFLQVCPDVFALAALEEDRLLKLWEGLGYYNRARNLQKCAKVLAQRGGRFPETKAELRKLPGIGDYTAGAIASICFEQPAAAVDGNVLRVCTRVLEDATPIDDTAFKKALGEALGAVYPAGRCGDFTQALMELGATVCVPNGAPKCAGCPIRAHCLACEYETQGRFPVKKPKKARREEEHTVLLLRCGERVAVGKRPDRGLLAGLWELPHTEGLLSETEVGEVLSGRGFGDVRLRSVQEGEHIFTHIRWALRCYTAEVSAMPEDYVWVTEDALRGEISLPTAFRQFVESL